MRRKVLAACVVAATIGFAGISRAANYKIDPNHTHVLFLVDHLGFSKMIGLFTEIAGTLAFDPANVAASKLTVAIKTASLQTQFTPRDNDLKGADWFDVTEFPEMKFVGTSFSKKAATAGTMADTLSILAPPQQGSIADRTGTMTGNLTLHGVTRPVTLDVTFNKVGVRSSDHVNAAGFSAIGKLRRSDFGMKTFLPYIGDEIDIVIETEAIQ